jgi:hypothetical protein
MQENILAFRGSSFHSHHSLAYLDTKSSEGIAELRGYHSRERHPLSLSRFRLW